MRIAGFADAHLAGMDDMEWRQQDFVDALCIIVKEICAWEPDLILFGGDAFQGRTPSPQWVVEFAKAVSQFAAIAPICLIPGNHDQTAWGSMLRVLDVMALPNVYYLDAPKAIEINGVQIFGMPWLTTRHLSMRGLLGDEAKREMEKLARVGITALLAQPFDGPRIFLGHLTMLGATFGGFTPVTIGHEVFWQASWLDGFDCALLGHLHRHQFPDPSRSQICYTGSLERLNFGEREEEKGWVSIDLGAKEPTWEFHGIHTRPMVQIEMESDKPEIALDIPMGHESVVKAIIHVPAGRPNPDVRADCKHLTVYYIREGKERQSRAPSQIAEMEIEEQLRYYWNSREIPAERQEILVQHAKEVMFNDT